MATKKYVSLSKLSYFLDNLRSVFALKAHTHSTSDISDFVVDTELSSTSTNPVQNKVIDAEFEAMATAMNALELAIDSAVEEVKTDASNKDVVVLHEAQKSANSYTDTKVGELNESFGNVIYQMYGSDLTEESAPTIREIASDEANIALDFAKSYADSSATTAANNVKNDLLNGAGEAYDTLKELGDLIEENTDALEALESIASGKADASHTHDFSDINNLQTTLDGKADSSHTHTVANITDLTATATELNYMDGVTSNVQTQLDTLNSNKVNKSGDTMTGDLTIKADFGSVRFNDSDGNKMSVLQASDNDHTTSIYAYPTDKSTYYERYDLPTPSTGRTSNKAYKILTSKDVTASVAELNFVEGVTHSVQTQLNDRFKKSDVIPVTNGGTGATDVAEARTNLGLEDSITLKNVEITLPYGNNWSDVVYGNGKFVAVAENSSVAVYSTNGATWTETTMPISAQWKSIVYGNGKFVAVAYGTDVAAYSTDGITWTDTTMPSNTNWQTVAFGNGTFIAAAFSSYRAAYSTDGITWTETTLPSSVAWYCASFGNNTFVVVANNNNKVAYSTDGITWESADMPSSANWVDVTFGNGKFVAIASSNTMVAYSADGITWESGYMPVSTTWARVAFGNGVFVSITNNSTRTAYSTDGAGWTAAEMTLSRSWRCFTYGDGKFVAIPYGDTDATISTDGINWSTSAQVLKDVNDVDITQTVKSALGISGASASGADVNNAVLITVEDIDAICGATIQVANLSEVTF